MTIIGSREERREGRKTNVDSAFEVEVRRRQKSRNQAMKTHPSDAGEGRLPGVNTLTSSLDPVSEPRVTVSERRRNGMTEIGEADSENADTASVISCAAV